MRHHDNEAMAIECAVCGKQVDYVEWCDELATLDRVISVRCHGQVETVRVPATVWMEFHPRDVRWGKAFETRRIDGGRM